MDVLEAHELEDGVDDILNNLEIGGSPEDAERDASRSRFENRGSLFDALCFMR